MKYLGKSEQGVHPLRVHALICLVRKNPVSDFPWLLSENPQEKAWINPLDAELSAENPLDGEPKTSPPDAELRAGNLLDDDALERPSDEAPRYLSGLPEGGRSQSAERQLHSEERKSLRLPEEQNPQTMKRTHNRQAGRRHAHSGGTHDNDSLR